MHTLTQHSDPADGVPPLVRLGPDEDLTSSRHVANLSGEVILQATIVDMFGHVMQENVLRDTLDEDGWQDKVS